MKGSIMQLMWMDFRERMRWLKTKLQRKPAFKVNKDYRRS